MMTKVTMINNILSVKRMLTRCLYANYYMLYDFICLLFFLVLKEGMLKKRAQNKSGMGMSNWKERFFRLTHWELS